MLAEYGLKPEMDGKETAKRFLYKTWDPAIYLNFRFLYAYGNTPAENVLDEFDFKQKDLNILLLGAGDIRHFLKTVGDLPVSKDPWNIKTRPDSLNVVMNDIDGVLLARNIILLHLCNTLNTHDQSDMLFLWAVWYNATLSKEHHQRLKSVLMSLLSDVDGGNTNLEKYWHFGNDETKKEIKEMWKIWLNTSWNKIEVDKCRSRYLSRFADRLETASVTNSFNARSAEYEMALKDRWTKDKKEFWKTFTYIPLCAKSVTNDIAINPTLMRSVSNEWCLHYRSHPSDSYLPLDIDEYKAAGQNLLELCFSKMKNLVDSYQKAAKNIDSNVTLWLGDALYLCSHGFPQELKFDVIHTSNLMDHLGLLNVLLACKSRLRSDTSIMMTETMKWAVEFDSLTEYLSFSVGCDVQLFPTVLGLHLAEDLEIGSTRNTNTGFISKLVWMLAKQDASPIDIEKSPCINEAVEAMVNLCCKSDVPFTNANMRNAVVFNPLALMELSIELGRRVSGGADTILAIIDKNIKETYKLQWETVKTAFGMSRTKDALMDVSFPSNFKFPVSSEAVGYSQKALFWMHKNGAEISVMMQIGRGLFPYTEGGLNVISNYTFNPERQELTILVPESYWNDTKQLGGQLCVDDSQRFGSHVSLKSLKGSTCVRNIDIPVYAPIDTSGPTSSTISVAKVVSIGELMERYEVELDVSNMERTMNVKSQCMPYSKCADTFQLQISFKCGKRTKSCIQTFLFSHQFNENDITIKVSNKRGKIYCTIPKMPYLGRKHQPLCCIDISKLPKLMLAEQHECGISSFGLQTLMAQMFESDTVKKMNRGRTQDADPTFDFRESIQALWIFCQFHPEKTFKVFSSPDHNHYTQYNGEALTMVIKGQYWYAGLPLLHIQWLDWREVFALANPTNQLPFELMMKVEESIFNAAGRVLDGLGRRNVPQEIFHKLNSYSPVREKFLGKEHDVFRKVIEVNAARLQKNNPPKNPWEFRESFLQVYFPHVASMAVRMINKSVKMLSAGLSPEQVMEQSIPKDMSREQIQDYKTKAQNLRDSLALDEGKKHKSRCDYCFAIPTNRKLCSRCRNVYYCNSECQRKHWSDHKYICTDKNESDKISQTSNVKANTKEQLDETRNNTNEKCSVCLKSNEALKKCSRCKEKSYCSRECQLHDWPHHKKLCTSKHT